MILNFRAHQFEEGNESCALFLLNKFHLSSKNRVAQIVLDTFIENMNKFFLDPHIQKFQAPENPQDKLLTRINTCSNFAFRAIPNNMKRLSEFYVFYKKNQLVYFNIPSWIKINVLDKKGQLSLIARKKSAAHWDQFEMQEEDQTLYFSLFDSADTFSINRKKNWTVLSNYILNSSNGTSEALLALN